MKEKYESLIICVTAFDEEDVITTSDYNNAYQEINDLGTETGRRPPAGPWY